MNKNEVAIIGGAGFVGSRLTARLKKINVLSNKYDETIYLELILFLKNVSILH